MRPSQNNFHIPFFVDSQYTSFLNDQLALALNIYLLFVLPFFFFISGEMVKKSDSRIFSSLRTSRRHSLTFVFFFFLIYFHV